MDDIKVQGIVLRYTNINESDRMLTVFSPEMGKISVLARGCRKPGSRFLSASQLFAHCSYILKRYRDIYILVQAEVLNSFYDISKDMQRLANAAYILNLTEEAVIDGDENYCLFQLLIDALKYLAYDDTDPLEVTNVYELKFISLIGYHPELNACISCGRAITGNQKFSPEEGGLLCSSCSLPDEIPVSPGTVLTMRHILEMDISGLRVLKFYPEVRKQLNMVLSEYIFCKLDKRIRSREFIDPMHYKTT